MSISKYDLLQMINRNNHDASETIQDINELVDEGYQNPKEWFDELKDQNNEFADKLNLCRKCGNELEVIDSWKESRGEMYGREVYEEMCTYGCTKCGYIKE